MNGKQLREWRLSRKISGEEAAFIFGKSRGTICRWESEWKDRELSPWVSLLCELHDDNSKGKHKRNNHTPIASQKRRSKGSGKKTGLPKQRPTSLERVVRETSRRLSAAIKAAGNNGRGS